MSRNVEDLHPKIRDKAKEFLKRSDEILGEKQAFITDGFRSKEEQTALYAIGRTKPGKIVTYAKAGESPHNYGLAFDIAFRADGTKGAYWDVRTYKKLANLAKELGLTWGGIWEMRDNPHYELKDWRKYKENIVVKSNIDPYSGLDLTNIESMREVAKTWKEVIDGKFIRKEDYEKDLAERNGQIKQSQTQIDELKKGMGKKEAENVSLKDELLRVKKAFEDEVKSQTDFGDDAAKAETKLTENTNLIKKQLAVLEASLKMKIGVGSIDERFEEIRGIVEAHGEREEYLNVLQERVGILIRDNEKLTKKVERRNMAKGKIKDWYKSKTILLAILQGVVGVGAVFATEYPEVAVVVVVKSIFDIVLRLITTKPVK